MIDWTKPIETTNGTPATFIKKLETTSDYTHLVVYQTVGGEERARVVKENGECCFRNKKQEVSRFVVLVPSPGWPDDFSCHGYFTSEEEARKRVRERRWVDAVIREWTVEV